MRAGYAAADSTSKFPSVTGPVADAQAAAVDAGVGLHSETAPCTVPAKVKAYAAKVDQAHGVPMPTGDLGAFETRLNELQALRAEGDVLAQLLAGTTSALPLAAYDAPLRTSLTSTVDAQKARVDALAATVKAARDSEQAAADRAAAERSAKQASADRAAAEQAARDAEDAADSYYYDDYYYDDYYYEDPSDYDGDGFPDDGTPYDCIAPWDYSDSWTQDEEDNFYACMASM